MNAPQTFEQALEAALARLRAGENVDDILVSYPRQAADLAPLLQTGRRLGPMRATQPPSPGALAAGRRRMLELAASRRRPTAAARVAAFLDLMRERSSLQMHAHPLAATFAALTLLAVTAGGGALAASVDSPPGSPLFPLRLAQEQARLALTFDAAERETLQRQFEERLRAETGVQQQDRDQDRANDQDQDRATDQDRDRDRDRWMASTPTCTPQADPKGPMGPSVTPTQKGPIWPTMTPQPNFPPGPTIAPWPTNTPYRWQTPQASRTPVPNQTAMPTQTPAAYQSPGPHQSPIPNQTAMPSQTPGAYQTPGPNHTPVPNQTAMPAQTPGAYQTPGPNQTPGPR